uniref:SOSS complex subunit C n=1 Tax=Phasianus colchicus TaxID=9054 RepID=A0A669QHE6_PHACC
MWRHARASVCCELIGRGGAERAEPREEGRVGRDGWGSSGTGLSGAGSGSPAAGPDLQVSVRLTFELSETGPELKDGSESLGTSIALARSPLNKDFRDHAEQQHIAAQQKAALQHAHAHSSGYFITQDSAFGNLILPVLPRLEAE